ncbi:hypothetical protein GCM10009677_53470 [Sphaerisporangium rubeum]|uniref:Uncharacterized protein n=1 Tax=Sphaerisporangium rubeum TaxID=321317 RepID=A0A7X0M8M7_9ACTN|nr:hypothetical protein [Sphaerisporangium rubeum]MBB6475547.1 hypothetical protein [Sphaerisporangium rubeum]
MTDLPNSPNKKKIRQQAHQDAIKGTKLAFQHPPPGDRRPPREISEAERHGVPPTDTHATSALDVGQSMTTRPERLSREKHRPGRVPAGEHPRTGRPAGAAGPDHFTGVGTDRGGPVTRR